MVQKNINEIEIFEWHHEIKIKTDKKLWNKIGVKRWVKAVRRVEWNSLQKNWTFTHICIGVWINSYLTMSDFEVEVILNVYDAAKQQSLYVQKSKMVTAKPKMHNINFYIAYQKIPTAMSMFSAMGKSMKIIWLSIIVTESRKTVWCCQVCTHLIICF